jgi:hypothetical protein
VSRLGLGGPVVDLWLFGLRTAVHEPGAVLLERESRQGLLHRGTGLDRGRRLDIRLLEQLTFVHPEDGGQG